VLFHQVVIETVFELSIFPFKKDRRGLSIYLVRLGLGLLPRACEAGPTILIAGKVPYLNTEHFRLSTLYIFTTTTKLLYRLTLLPFLNLAIGETQTFS
jgi:hypothetical protein